MKTVKIGAMVGDIFESFFRRPATQRYPFERTLAPERLRGKLIWDPAKCTGCGLCSKDCPSNAIEVTIIDRAAKKFVMTYHVDRCTFCAQCVQNCRFKCIRLSSEQWELAALSKEPFTVYYGDDATLQAFLENLTPQLAEPEPAA